MKQKFFKLNENFENIINSAISDKSIIKCNLIPTGWTNIVYEVETNQGNYFFRFPRDEFWARTIIKDCEFAKYINNKTDFKTVNLELKYDNERPFSIHKKIEGTSLADKMFELNEKEVKNISNEIAKFMYQLHNINFSNSNIFKVNNIGVNLNEFLDELLNKHVKPEKMKFWENKINDESDNEVCLVHGDLNSSNILLDKNNNISAIIDFGFGGFGNKYNDIARIIGRCPENFREHIIQSYELYDLKPIEIDKLEHNINTWKNIDDAYIDYMQDIGIYKKKGMKEK